MTAGTFTSDTTGWGSSQVSSTQGYSQGAYVSFASPSPTVNYFMTGLSITPNNSYTGVNYAFYINGTSLEIYESGTFRVAFEPPVVSTDTFTIVYDGQSVCYYRNGNLLRTVIYTLPTGSLFYMATPFLIANTSVSKLVFGPMGSAMPVSNTMNANWVLSGGGTITWDGTNVTGTNRVLAIPLNNAFASSGYVQVLQGSWSLNLGSWAAAYWVPNSLPTAYSAENGVINIVNYTNVGNQVTTNWIFICATNGDTASLKWGPGFITIPSGGSYNDYSPANGGGSSWNLMAITSKIALGNSAGVISQGATSVAIGSVAGYNTQGTRSIAIGDNAGTNNQKTQSVAVGYYAGYNNQSGDSIAFGSAAGYSNQGPNSVAIGNLAGQYDHGSNCIGIGCNAGLYAPYPNCIAIGTNAGANSGNENTIAIGQNAGYLSARPHTISIGTSAGTIGQLHYSIAIGSNAGANNQGSNSIAIGTQAGESNQNSNSIVLNATGSTLNASVPGFIVAPVRQQTGEYLMAYDTTTKEISYTATSSSDERLKKDISDTQLGLSFINQLRPVQFRWVDRNTFGLDASGHCLPSTSPGVRVHQGLIAQEVKKVLDDMGVDSAIHVSISSKPTIKTKVIIDASGNKSTSNVIEINPLDGVQGVRYEELISPIIQSVKDIHAVVQTQAIQIQTLQQMISNLMSSK